MLTALFILACLLIVFGRSVVAAIIVALIFGAGFMVVAASIGALVAAVSVVV